SSDLIPIWLYILLLTTYFRLISNGMAEMVTIAEEFLIASQRDQGCSRFFRWFCRQGLNLPSYKLCCMPVLTITPTRTRWMIRIFKMLSDEKNDELSLRNREYKAMTPLVTGDTFNTFLDGPKRLLAAASIAH